EQVRRGLRWKQGHLEQSAERRPSEANALPAALVCERTRRIGNTCNLKLVPIWRWFCGRHRESDRVLRMCIEHPEAVVHHEVGARYAQLLERCASIRFGKCFQTRLVVDEKADLVGPHLLPRRVTDDGVEAASC